MDVNQNERIYTKYIRDGAGVPHACIVGVFQDGKPPMFGWSICKDGKLIRATRRQRNDQFNYKRARQIAIGRARKPPKRFPPDVMAKALTEVIPAMVEWDRDREKRKTEPPTYFGEKP